jgi:thioredoxin-like negative regulator of GroEL
LESGEGSLARADLTAGSWQTIIELPGFTRGIDFLGPLAFIGLSKVRESAVFSGIPLVKRLKERNCGVWVVNIETGQVLGFLRFESGVEEIFAVQVLKKSSYPEILDFDDPLLAQAYVLPDAALAEVKLPSEAERAESPSGLFQQGLLYYKNAQLSQAITAFQQCLKAQASFPNARYNLGVALGDADQFAEAIKQLQQVITDEPERAEAFNSLGKVYSRQGQNQAALEVFQQAIEQQPDDAQAHFNLGITLLKAGDYTRGWDEYEWRWRTGQFTPFQCPHPLWEGEAILEKTLLIYTEQGAGDAVQFARYIPLVAERCQQLIVVCITELIPLFSTLKGIDQLREPGQIKVSEFDTYLPLISLPRIFKTTLTTIPDQLPYFDRAALRRRKQAIIETLATTLERKIGIVWAGSQTHQNDRHHSCPLVAFEPLLRSTDMRFYSLQKGERSQDLATLPSELTVEDLAPQLNDYGELALWLEPLDLVISVDTSVAHVAAAFGQPVWLLLSQDNDWRWGINNETTPWYPGIRLFRQTQLNNWDEVMERVLKELLSFS